ncbi:ABC transporter ATP-binding protein, partial [Mycobacterium sp. CPCC 205372]|nr:ABC transporter ATP-binding protein [Mycobacterium hippophais]
VREIMGSLPEAAQEAIREDLEGTNQGRSEFGDEPTSRHHRSHEDDAPTASIPVARER